MADSLFSNRHKERKKLAKEKAVLKPKSDDSISTVLEEDEELGRTDSSEDGLQTLLHDVEGLLDDDDDPSSSPKAAAGKGNVQSVRKSSPTSTPRTDRKSVEETLQAMDAPKELRQATALLLQTSLVDETTARLLASDILDQPMEGGPSEDIGDQAEEKDNAAIEDEPKESTEDVKTNDESITPAGGNGSSSSLNEHVNTTVSTIGDDETQQEPPASTTSGFSPSFKTNEMLRPSIFTMHEEK